MMRVFHLVFLITLFVFVIGTPAFADIPKILKVSEIQPGIKAVGFSVFKGVEPQLFDVELGEVIDAGGFNLILARISGGPMETPLEEIGAIAGMSGSPIFVGCDEYNECLQNGTLVGALSYSLGSFIKEKGSPNAGLTPAEYMLGASLGGYTAASQFSTRPPNKIMAGGREFQNLLLFSGISSSPVQGVLPNGSCGNSVKSDIKPGSMVTVFLAKGSWNIGSSGTVTWRDEDRIYVFGHPFFGTGEVSYPFVHVAVADTIQTPFNAEKIVGCRLETEGAMLVDGMYEMAGIIGRQAQLLPFQAELHIGNSRVIFNEEIAESPWTFGIINQLPVFWAQQMLGDMSYISVAYQTRIAVANEPEIFMKSLMSAQVVKYPLAEVFARISATLGKLKNSGFSYNLESIKTHIDFIRGEGAWIEKRSFLSQDTAKSGETVFINVILEEISSKAVKQVSIPIKVPDDFMNRVMPKTSSEILVSVQSADNFVDRTAPKEITSLRNVIQSINESVNYKANVLYVQQVMPLSKAERESEEASAKLSVKPNWSWTELDQGGLRRLPQLDNKEIIMTTTPELDHFIDFDETFKIQVDISGGSETPNQEAVKENKDKGWFDYLKFWRLF